MKRQITVLSVVFGVALISSAGYAQTISCAFNDNLGRAAAITFSADSTWIPGADPISGTITFVIQDFPVAATFPAKADRDDESGKIEKKDGKLSSVKVFYNQGHQMLYLSPSGENLQMILELPDGLMGGGTINTLCRKP
jgi:hypothetical protein